MPVQVGFRVAVGHDHDGRGDVAKFLDGCQVVGGLADIDGVVPVAVLVQPTLRCLARLATGGRVDGDIDLLLLSC